MNNPLAIITPENAQLRPNFQPIRVIGIDLGTTNSTVAEIHWHPTDNSIQPHCLEIEQETTAGPYTHILIPSAVTVYNGQVWVGEGAKRLYARSAEIGLEVGKNLFLECKNDIGAQRTYQKAPEGFRSAAEIGGKVLEFLRNSAMKENQTPVSRFVVTVPASFQAAQRLDTVKAAKLAGISLGSGDLLDEPIAAFLDYLVSHSDRILERLDSPTNLLVFDFGGGTCDVAIFHIVPNLTQNHFQISPLAVSRYLRLGGGDIDRAILYEVLLPQLLEQNKLASSDISYEDKKNVIEPAFLGVAEVLKIGLCNEIHRLKQFDQNAKADKKQIIKKLPGRYACILRGKSLELLSPALSAEQFETILEPFLDRDFLYARETEYRMTCSIFASIQNALDRSRLEAKSLPFCLLVGGSSLIPQVVDEIQKFFPQAEILSYDNPEDIQTAVARGAACQALALALYGQSIFQMVTHNRISIRTKSGAYDLIPQGVPLPFPQNEAWMQCRDLIVPETSLINPVNILIELLAGDKEEEWPLFTEVWEAPAPVNRGDKLVLKYRMDENQVLEFELSLTDNEEETPFSGRIENPLTNVVNPNAIALKIQRIEEELRTGKIPQSQIPETVVEIARDYAELNQREKAISYLERAWRMKKQPDSYILNLLGIYHGELGNYEKEEKFYRESAHLSPMSGAMFNLALSQKNRSRFREAAISIDDYLMYRSNGPGWTLKAMIAEKLGNESLRTESLEAAFNDYANPKYLDEWELGWYMTACQMSGEKGKLEAARKEQKKRQNVQGAKTSPGGIPPEIMGSVAKT
ncbi:MAG: Hsp70 family protein [Candidatus Omnitrophota bacterium]